MAQPLLIKLRQSTAPSPIDVLASSWVAPVVRHMPEVRRVIEFPFRHGRLQLVDRWRIARRLRRNGYRRAYVLPNSMKSALVPWLAGIEERIGWHGESRYGLLNKRYRLEPGQSWPLAAQFARLADGECGQVPQPRLKVSAHRARQAMEKLAPEHRARPLALAIGAEYGPAKRWPARHFATVAHHWIAKRGGNVWLLGTRSEQESASAINEALPGSVRAQCLDLCGKTTLDEAIALLAEAQLVVSNDSGLMHIGAALNRPLISLYGSSSPTETPPLNDSATVLSLELPCAPCFARVCPLGHTNCLVRLMPRQVIAHMNA